MLKPINSFETRSHFKPHFDQGDVITNGDKIITVTNITSRSDGVFYTTNGDEERYKPYKKTNSEYELIKKGDDKIKYYISNGGDLNHKFLHKVVFGEVPYVEWFEKEYRKLTK